MAKPEWGTKRTCLNCAVRFYDLGKKPITCPACESTFEPEAFVKTRRSRQSAPSEPKKPAAPVEAEKPEVEEPEAEAPDAAAAGAGDDDDAILPVAADTDDESEDVAELVDTPGETKGDS